MLDLLFGNTLTLLVFFPALACVPLLFFPQGSERAVKVYALVVSLVELAFAIDLAARPTGARASFATRRRERADPLAAALRHRLRPAYGRHLDAAGAPRDVPPAHRLPRLLEGDRQALAGLRRGAAAAHHRRARHALRLGPLPLLRLLGGHADPDVSDHRDLGRRAADLRGGEILPVHHGRQPADARGHPVDGLELQEPERRRLELRLRRHAAAGVPAARADLAVRGLRARLRRQGADVPGAHLAAGRARRGAHRRLGDPGGHPAEARHVRLPALRPAALPAASEAPAVPRDARGDRHPLRRARLVDAGGHEEAGGLFVDRPPRLRHARPPRSSRRPGRARSSRW